MKRNLFLKSLTVCIILFLSIQTGMSQPPIPWTLAGNSNVSASSKFGTLNSTDLKIVTNNLERIRITPSGLVGIGTTTPTHQLHVVGNGLFTAGVNISDGGINSTNNFGYGITSFGTTSGVAAFGSITGISAYGNTSGLYASGSTYAVQGVGGMYGFYGSGNNYGVFGSGSLGGVWGNTGNGYYGVLGTSTNYNGVYGFGATNGVFGTTNGAANALLPTTAGVYGNNNNYGVGVLGSCFNGSGVAGYSVNYYAGYFTGNVYSTGQFLPSDGKLKSNVNDFLSAMDIINQLKPKQYKYRQDGNYKLMNLPAGNHYGLIAEDLERILPQLVKATKFDPRMINPDMHEQAILSVKNISDGTPAPASSNQKQISPDEIIDFKAVNYTELIPIMIKGMQEQQEQIEDLKQQVEELNNLITKIVPRQLIPVSSALLGQNIPNPVKNSTSIRYNLPSGFNAGHLLLTDELGRKIKEIQLGHSGTINLSTAELGTGVYNYSMIIDGKTIATKKMLVTKN